MRLKTTLPLLSSVAGVLEVARWRVGGEDSPPRVGVASGIKEMDQVWQE